MSTLTEVRWTPSAGNALMLSKGDGWEEGLHWKAEIHGFPQMPVKYIIHRDWHSKNDVLHTFWEQVGGNKHCWMPLCIHVREQESVELQQRQLCTSASSNKKYELQKNWEERRLKLPWASSSSFYSHFQAEISHTSKDAVTMVTGGEPKEVLPPVGRSREQQH